MLPKLLASADSEQEPSSLERGETVHAPSPKKSYMYTLATSEGRWDGGNGVWKKPLIQISAIRL